jgi:hypothetical protein
MEWLHEQLARQAAESAGVATVRGKIAEDASSVTDPLYVTVDAFDGGRHRFGPCPWPSRVDATGAAMLPNKGDLVLISEDDKEQPWILAWWPYEL